MPPVYEGYQTYRTDPENPIYNWFSGLPIGYNPAYVAEMYDFNEVALDATNAWTVVKDSSATVAIGADTQRGRVLLTSQATTDDDGGSIQGNETWKVYNGRELWFECRLQISDADDMDVFVGLCENFATNPENCLAASNRIGFQINDGNASILTKTEASDVETSKDSEIDIADGTDIVLGFKAENTGIVKFYVNRVLVSTHETNIPTTELTPAVMEISGSATGTKAASVDYIFVAMTRL